MKIPRYTVFPVYCPAHSLGSWKLQGEQHINGWNVRKKSFLAIVYTQFYSEILHIDSPLKWGVSHSEIMKNWTFPAKNITLNINETQVSFIAA